MKNIHYSIRLRLFYQERIRDKLAASKKKGMWMGGSLPLGYNLNGRKLVVNKEKARQVKDIFNLYLELKSIQKLYEELNRRGYKMKQWKTKKGNLFGGSPYTKHSTRTILSNVVYLGKISHKGKVYEGEQEAIIDEALWDKVQKQLAENTQNIAGKKNESHNHLLKNKLFDEMGYKYTTTHTTKKGRRHYYYVNPETKVRINAKALHDTLFFALDNDKDFICALKCQ